VRGVRAAAIGLLALATGAVIGLDVSGAIPGPLGRALSPRNFADAPSLAAVPGALAAQPVLAPLPSSTSRPTTTGLARALEGPLASPDLGPDVAVVVVDGSSGRALYGRQPGRAQAPASTVKVLTSIAALSTLGPQAVLRTKVVDTGSFVVLVGGGDPTLTTRTARGSTAPSLEQLADRTAAALKQAGRVRVGVRFDDSLFSGPTVSPAWPKTYVETGVVAPVTALRVDSGRVSVRGNARVLDPSAVAASRFADLLRGRGITVVGPQRRVVAPASAPVLAEVRSQAVATIVESMLTRSDDDAAEALAHLAGAASGNGGSFAGGAAATRRVLQSLGVPVAGLVLKDGSGLARTDLAPPRTLSTALVMAGSRAHPELRSTLTGLPVAGFTGTLADRFVAPTTRQARGVARAKTGTLSGVTVIAGSLVDASGTPLVYAVMADKVPFGGTESARVAVDRVVATLASCGCR
jgi:serine-type D-Ala-D-Ala carboxypeptidase/endopeptidase (penicillin-binding protein 4)